MIGRCDETLVGKHILRLEAELKRTALKRHLGKPAMETSYKLLSAAPAQSAKAVSWCLSRMQPQGEKYLRYTDAAELVRDAGFKKETEERMLYLLRKVSDIKSLTAVLEKLCKKYDLSKSKRRTVLKKFQKLGISPITLQNTSKWDELPSIPI